MGISIPMHRIKFSPSDTLLEGVHALPEVKELYVYVTKPAILKSKQEIHGVVLHGVDSTFKGDFFIENLKEGEFPDFHTVSPSNEILLFLSGGILFKFTGWG